jgi:hypothetical protein
VIESLCDPRFHSCALAAGSLWHIILRRVGLGALAFHSSQTFPQASRPSTNLPQRAQPNVSPARVTATRAPTTEAHSRPGRLFPCRLAGRACWRKQPTEDDFGRLERVPSLAHREYNPSFTMAAANGTLTPPSLPPAPVSPSVAKRKLAGNHAIVANGASASAQGTAANATSYSLQATLGDILAVLKRYANHTRLLHSTWLLHLLLWY